MGGFLLLLLIAVIYSLPTIVAIGTKHINWIPIAILNLLLGWTFIGWVVALVWSCKK